MVKYLKKKMGGKWVLMTFRGKLTVCGSDNR